MLMNNEMEYSDKYSKTIGNLYQFCRDNLKNLVTDSESFKSKWRLFHNVNNAGTINAEIAVLLKSLSNFWSS